MARSRTRGVAKALLAGICFAALLAAAPARAQDAAPQQQAARSDEIIVTAQRRAERSLDVPIAITSVDAEQLQAAGATQLSDIVRVAPALRFDSAATFVQPTIRGVGTAVATSGGGGNVGIYVDGFYSPNPAVADFQLMNVESVQVLRGPQGTLFGRNTTGGAILVTTADPSFTPGFGAEVRAGSYGAHRAQAYVTAPIGEHVAVDLEGLFTEGDGFVDNITTGSNRDGAYDTWSVRGGILLEPVDGLSVLLRHSHSDVDDPTMMNTNLYIFPDGTPGSAPAFGSSFATDPDEVATSGPSEYRSINDITQLTVRTDLGFADLTSYTQYRLEDTLMVEDLDHTAGVRPFVLHIDVDDRTISQEFLLTSHPGTRLQWTAGLFYMESEDTWLTNLGATAPGDLSSTRFGGSSTTTSSLAFFADGTYEINPQLYLTLGARYSHDEVTDAYYIVPVFFNPTLARTNVPDLEDDTVTPRIVLRYEPTPESSVYVSYTQGYKAGVLDVGGATGNPVAPEEINAYEVGYKYEGGALSFDLAAFYYDYQNLQVSLYRDNGSGAPSAAILNAASSEIYGLEGQVRYDFNEHFSVNAGAAWTHARYERFENAPVYTPCPTPSVPAPGTGCPTGGESFFVPIGVTLSNVTMQRTPEWTANLGARYVTDMAGGELALSGNVYYTSEFFHGPSGIQFEEDAYEVVNLRAAWTDPSDHYTVALFGDNVTDQRYRTQVQYNQYGIGNVWSAPATYGVSVSVRY